VNPVKYKLLITVLFLLVSLNSILFADEASHLRATEDLLAIMNIENILNQSIEKMVNYQIAKNPKIASYKDLITNFYKKYSGWNVIKDDIIAMYKDTFREREINDLIKFYRSDTGQKALSNIPSLMVQSIALGQRNIQKNIPELQKEIEKRKEK